MLATLAIAANQVVSTDRLMQALWGDQLPATAANALQARVSKLRKKLDARSGRQPLVSAPQGYLLRTEPGEADLHLFDRPVEQVPTDPVARAAQLRDALALWRGSALADVASDLLDGEKARLDEHRLAVLERRIDADLALGRHGELVGELEALVRTHPLRERLRGQLMMALYRAGRLRREPDRRSGRLVRRHGQSADLTADRSRRASTGGRRGRRPTVRRARSLPGTLRGRIRRPAQQGGGAARVVANRQPHPQRQGQAGRAPCGPLARSWCNTVREDRHQPPGRGTGTGSYAHQSFDVWSALGFLSEHIER